MWRAGDPGIEPGVAVLETATYAAYAALRTVLRTSGWVRVRKVRLSVRTVSQAFSAKNPCKGRRFAVLRLFRCQWRRWGSNPPKRLCDERIRIRAGSGRDHPGESLSAWAVRG